MFVYVWKHNDTPFYVGMTKHAGRANPLNAGGRGWLCKQTLVKIGPNNVVTELHTLKTLEEAIALERSLIEKYGRIQLQSGTLTNLKPGGDGSSSMTEAGRLATSKRMKEHNPTKNPETRAKIKSRMNAPDVKIKFIGENNPSKRPEVRDKIRAKWADPLYREAQRQRKLGKPIHSEEEKEKRRQKLLDPNNPMREFHKTLNTDPEINKKRSEGVKAWWAKRKERI
jgi:hypothetical protein